MDADAQQRLARAEAALAEARRVGRRRARGGARRGARARADAAGRGERGRAKTLADARAQLEASVAGERREAAARRRPRSRVGRRARSWAARWRREDRGAMAVACLALTLLTSAPAFARRARGPRRAAAHEPRASTPPPAEHGAGAGDTAPPANDGPPPIDGGRLAAQFFNFARAGRLLLLRRARPGQQGAAGAPSSSSRPSWRRRPRRAPAAAGAPGEAGEAAGRAGARDRGHARGHQAGGRGREGAPDRAAEERASRIREETTFLLDQQVKEAELRSAARRRGPPSRPPSDRARQLGAGDQQRLVDSFVADVAGNGRTRLPDARRPRPPTRHAPERRSDGGRGRIRRAALRARPVRHRRRRRPLRGAGPRAGRARRRSGPIGRAAPDAGEPGVQARARSAPCWSRSCRGSRRRPRCSASCCCCSSAAASCCCPPSRAPTRRLADEHARPRARAGRRRPSR